MKKIFFLLALLFMASMSYVNAQLFVQKNQDLTFGQFESIERTESRADLKLGYTNSATPNSYAGYNVPVGNFYASACIYFSAGQMYNYVGGSMHSIETFVPVATQGANNFMLGWTAYKVWIKNALDGTPVYEQDVTSQVTLGALNTFVLNTPYQITNAPLVIGYTVTFNLTGAAVRYPLPFANNAGPYPAGAHNIQGSTLATGYGSGASWGLNTDRALLIWGHVTGNALPANDVAAIGLKSTPLKWINNPTTYSVDVFNAGTASQNNFTVQLIDAANNILGTQTITTALAAGALRTVVFDYTPSAVGNFSVRGKVILTGDQTPANDISEPLIQKVYPMQPMAYCDNSTVSGVGAGADVVHQAAIGYPVASMTPYVGKYLTHIEFALGVPISTITGNITVWVRSSLTGANLYEQTFTPVGEWNSVQLTTPYVLPNSAVYIGWTGTANVNYIIGTTANTMNAANGGHLQYGTSSWSTLSAITGFSGNNAIIGVVSETLPTTTYTITTAVNPAGAGTVTGAGTYNENAPVTLTASANSGYAFANWSPGGLTANPLNFNATANATYTANFTSTTPGDCNPPTGLTVTYTGDCKANLAWTAPTGKQNNSTPTVQEQMGAEQFIVQGTILPKGELPENATRTKGHFTEKTAGSIINYEPSRDVTLSPAAFNMPCGTIPGNLKVYVDDYDELVTGTNYWGDYKFGYLFKGTSGTVTSVKTWLLKAYNGSASNVVVELYAIGANNLPTTLLGTSQPISTSAITYNDIAEYTFTFATPVTVPTNFAAVVVCPQYGSSSSDIAVCTSPIDCYAAGTEYYPILYNSDDAAWWAMNDLYEMTGMFDLAIFPILQDGTPPSTVKYNIYRDGASIASNITTTSYTDATFDATAGHTWEVKVACDPTGESSATSATMPLCDDGSCRPVLNLNAEYISQPYGHNCTALVTWESPYTKINKPVNVNDPKYAFAPNYTYGVEKQEERALMVRPDMRRPAGMTQHSEEPKVEFNSGSRGNTAYGYIHYPSAHVGYWSWDVSNITGKTLIKGSMPGLYGGAFYDGKLYAFETITDLYGAYDCTYYVFDAATGTQISSVPRSELYGTIVSTLSYDYTTNVMYATASNILYTVNLTTGALTQVASITGLSSGSVLCMSIHLNGTMYVVNSGSANLYTVNKTSGVATLVGSTGQSITYAQSMSFDHADNTLYWCESGSDDYDNFMKINIATGSATMIQANTYEVTCLHFPYVAGTPCPAVTNLSVTNTGNTVNISWTASTGSPASYELKRDGTILQNNLTTSYTDVVPTHGTYNYNVRAIYPAANDCVPVNVSQSITIPETFGNCAGVVIGTATTSGYYMPVNTFYNHSYVQHLYTAAELTGQANKEITAIAFEYIYSTPNPKDPVTIYMGHTTKTAFASTSDWMPLSQMTEVFSGPLVFDNANKWFNIELTEPFLYEGGNLVVAVLNNHGSYSTSSNATFRYHNGGTNSTLRYQVDGTTPINPASPPAGTQTADRSNTRFIMCPVTGTYTVYRDGTELVSNYKKRSYLDASFDAQQPHTWDVVLVCGVGNEAPAVSVTKEPCQGIGDCTAPANLDVTYENDCTATLDWGVAKSPSIEKPEIAPKVWNNHEKDAMKEEMEATHNASQQMMRRNPNPITVIGAPEVEEFDGGFRGASSPLIYSNAQTDATPGTYKTTIGGYNQAGTQLSTISLSYQAMLYDPAADNIAVVTYNDDSEANTYGRLNMATGVFTQVATSGVPDAVSMAMNPLDGQVYVTQWAAAFGKINLANGAFTSIASRSDVMYIAIDNDGTCYGLIIGLSSSQFGTVNLTNGVFSQIATYGAGNWVQDINIDPETGILYHAYRDGSASTTQWRTIDKATGVPTNIGTFPSGRNPESFVIVGVAGTPCPAVTNLSVTNNKQTVNISWTPATGSPTSYELTRDGAVLQNNLSTSYTDVNVSSGNHNYCVKAIYPAGDDCIPQSVCGSILIPEDLGGNCEGKIVGTGTSTGNQLPVNTFYRYSYVQQIYDAAELTGNVGKNITGIAFEYIHNSPNPKEPFAIYVGQTTKSTFTSNTDWVSVSQMTRVYYGSIEFNNALPWFTINFDTPFTYTGGNLVVAILNNHGDYVTSSDPTFKYHTTTGNKTLHYRVDGSSAINPASPPSATGQLAQRANTRFTFCEPLFNIYRDSELIAQEHAGTTYTDFTFDPYAGHTWCVTPICPNGWEPLTPVCKTMTQCQEPLACNSCSFGTGTSTGYAIPMNTYYNYSYVQQIYDAADVCVPTGQLISAISFQYIHASCNVNKTVTLYLGNTTQSTFTSSATSWVPESQMQMVFNGTMHLIPNQPGNWVTIEFQTPFVYTGGNLVVGLDNNTGSYLCTSSDPTFRYHTATGNKTIYYNSDGTNPNPASPPSGTATTNRNNIQFTYCEPLTKDLAALSILGNCNPAVGVPYNYIVTVTNNGNATETDYTVQVLSSNNVVLGTATDVPAVAPLQTVSVNVPVTYLTTGETCIKGSVALIGDQNMVNNATPQPYTCYDVRPFSMDEIIVVPTCDPWSGTKQTQMPFNFYYKSSMVQSVYLSSEINMAGGFVKSLSWFYDATASVTDKQVKVWLANSNITNLASGWNTKDTVLVYEGTVSVTSGAPYQLTVQLAEPFLYTGGNLVVMTQRLFDDNMTNNVSSLVSPATNRSRAYSSDTSPFNWTQAGSVVNTVANLEMQITRVPSGTVGGHVTKCVDGTPMEDVTVSLGKYNLTTTTDNNGDYYFPFVPAEKGYNLTAKQLKYYDIVCPFDLNEGQKLDTSFCMTLRPGYTVYGTVQGSDGKYIVGAQLTLAGYDGGSTAVSGEYGIFEFNPPVLWSDTAYKLTVTADFWDKHTSTWIIQANTNMGTIILYDVPYKPKNVRATEINDNVARIFWDQSFTPNDVDFVNSDYVPEPEMEVRAVTPLHNPADGIVGYKLWRLQPGQENNEAAWTILTNNPVPVMDTKEYFDNSWANAAPGQYKWAVKTCYNMGVISKAVVSKDSLTKYAKTSYTINIVTSDGASPAGAVVSLVGDTLPGKIVFKYEGTVAINSVIFPSVVLGNYNLKVTLAGNKYKVYTDRIEISESGSYLVTLEEIVKAPYDLETAADTTCKNVTLTWNHATDTVYPNQFKVYLNDEEVGTVKTKKFVFENLEDGTYTAGVQAVYTTGVSEIKIINFEVNCLGIHTYNNDYKLYPNPASNHIFVARENATLATIDLYNSMGMHINSYETGDAIYSISVSNLAAGTYFIRITEGAKTTVKSFVKKND